MTGDLSNIAGWLATLPGAARLPFKVRPDQLYTVGRLYGGFTLDDPRSLDETFDERVFRWTQGAHGRPRPLGEAETVATRLHDAAMDRLVCGFVDGRPTVGVMGGHDVSRLDPAFAKAAHLARALRRAGFKSSPGAARA